MTQKSKGATFLDSLKLEILNIGKEYVKKNVKSLQKEALKYVERHIELKIKREIKSFALKAVGLLILLVGLVFLFYGLSLGVVYFLELPSFIGGLLFGGILLLAGILLWFS